MKQVCCSLASLSPTEPGLWPAWSGALPTLLLWLNEPSSWALHGWILDPGKQCGQALWAQLPTPEEGNRVTAVFHGREGRSNPQVEQVSGLQRGDQMRGWGSWSRSFSGVLPTLRRRSQPPSRQVSGLPAKGQPGLPKK